MSPKSWISVFGAVGVLVALASIVDQPRTKSLAFVVVAFALQATTPSWLLLALTSTGAVGAIPVKEATAISPCTTEPEKVAVSTWPGFSPNGAAADAIATWKLLVFMAWASIVHVRP